VKIKDLALILSTFSNKEKWWGMHRVNAIRLVNSYIFNMLGQIHLYRYEVKKISSSTVNGTDALMPTQFDLS